ncbi:MAG: DNA polymerase III subunit delta [Planctomycetota bacterium]|jgi:DNA polymerase-3 subunit delta
MPKAKTKNHEQIFVIAGKEDSLVGVECDKLLGELLEPQQRTTGLFNADPAEVSASDILDELRTLPFLTEKRVVVIKGADKFVSANRELLEGYFDSPCPTGILVLTVSSWPGNTKLAKKLPKVGTLINVTQPKAWQLPQRLIQYARDAHGKNMGREAAELLIELAGDDLGRLYGEIDKLAIFADTEKAITAEHVEQLTGHNRLFNAFAVIDAITAGDVAQAVDRLRTMFAEDKSAEYTVVGAFAFHFRRMFKAKVMLEEGVRPADIVPRLRIWSNKDSFFLQLRRMPLKKIGDILQQLADIDYAIKTGRTKPQVAIEQLVLSLAAG